MFKMLQDVIRPQRGEHPGDCRAGRHRQIATRWSTISISSWPRTSVWRRCWPKLKSFGRNWRGPIRTSRPSCGTTTMIDAGRPLRLDSRRFTSLLKAELGTQATSACAIEPMARSLAAPGAHNAWTSLDDIQTTKHRLARHQADCGRCVFAI